MGEAGLVPRQRRVGRLPEKNAGHSYSHDNLFHSLPGVFDVQTAEYRKKQDIFATAAFKATAQQRLQAV